MSRTLKMVVGAASVLPLAYVGWMLIMAEKIGSAPALGSVHIAVMILATGLWIYYVRDVYRSERVPPDKKALWVALLMFGNMLVWPIYFWLFVWREGPDTQSRLA